ncbi:hypothetical protein QYM36_017485 [Artemia franciscana]|uniref:Uncharacterized protein n=1 Tax=Artemia franciscana TaxID=6661 RepID=A0AA88HEZ6_ARTSF|nr:hypothetical protein QYM36_017485 [Artemia franciscana]
MSASSKLLPLYPSFSSDNKTQPKKELKTLSVKGNGFVETGVAYKRKNYSLGTFEEPTNKKNCLNQTENSKVRIEPNGKLWKDRKDTTEQDNRHVSSQVWGKLVSPELPPLHPTLRTDEKTQLINELGRLKTTKKSDNFSKPPSTAKRCSGKIIPITWNEKDRNSLSEADILRNRKAKFGEIPKESERRTQAYVPQKLEILLLRAAVGLSVLAAVGLVVSAVVGFVEPRAVDLFLPAA